MKIEGNYLVRVYKRMSDVGTWQSILDAYVFIGLISFAFNLAIDLIGFAFACYCMGAKFTILASHMSKEQAAIFWFFVIHTIFATIAITYCITKLYNKIINRPVVDFKTELSEMAKHEMSDYFVSGKMSQPFRDPTSPVSWTDQVRFYVDTASVEKYLDELTGCFNRKYFTHKLISYMNTQLMVNRRYRKDFDRYGDDMYGIFMIDIDHFKSINDVYGHAMGDVVLKNVGKLLRETIGDNGVVIRNGGEEFVIVYLAKFPFDFAVVAEHINQAFRDNIKVPSSGGIKGRDVTCSIGFVRFPFFENADQLFDLKEHVDLSDMAMYVSKTTGRDRWNELKATRIPTDKIDQSMYLNSPEYGLKRGYYVLRDKNGEHSTISDK